MKKQKFFTFLNIVYLCSTLFYIGIAIWAFILADQDFANRTKLLGTLIILSSVPHLFLYVADRSRLSFLVIGLVGVAFGIVILTTGDLFNEDQVCLIWGCIDICRGTTEIINRAPHVKQHKGELFEIAISLGDIVIGVLLCIHMLHGIQLHLIYLGIAFVASALKNINDLLLDRHKNAKSTNSD